jgi:hypothetical protein
MLSQVINTRADLDAIEGTQAHADFMAYLKGSMTQKHNVAVYPDGYGQPGYTGPTVDQVWEEYEDLSIIEQFGFTKADFA